MLRKGVRRGCSRTAAFGPSVNSKGKRVTAKKTSTKAYIASSERDDWETPACIFNPLHKKFKFTVDAAATKANSRVARHYDDAFAQPWTGQRIWCNPPYGRAQVPFVEEAARREAELSCLLIPARPDTRVWQDCIFDRAEVWFLRGRIRFSGAPASAPFPSAVVLFRPDDTRLVVHTGTLDEILAAYQ